jgi:hypothetical protein
MTGEKRIPLCDDRGERIGWIYTDDRPVCGLDFCDSCGDCLSCYDCPCSSWVVYADGLAGFLEEHEGARVEYDEEHAHA